MSIEKIEGLFAKFIAERFYNNYRKDLDKNPHFIPLDLSTLTSTLGHILIQTADPEMEAIAKANNIEITLPISELRNKIEAYAASVTKQALYSNGGRLYTEAGKEITIDTLLAKIGSSTNYINLPALIYNNSKELIGILFPSFGSASKTLFTDFLNKEISRFIKEDIYKNTSTKIGFDVGHVLDPRSPLYNSPLGMKLKSILGAVESVLSGETKFAEAPTTKVNAFKKDVQNIFNNLLQHSSYGPKISVNIDKDFGSVLLKINANVVIIQDRYENQRIYADLFESPTGAKILALIKDLHFSNSLAEEVVYRVKQTIKDGKIKPSKAKLSRPQLTTKLPNARVNLSTKSPKPTGSIQLPSAPKTDPQLDLLSLTGFINTHLQDVVSANMGDGSSKTILNYRTGRFAGSVKVEKLSQSREGMITAFYSYMKNPYATFSEGGQQDMPRSRDPKLLISKSIREIAAEKVAARLRAVAV